MTVFHGNILYPHTRFTLILNSSQVLALCHACPSQYVCVFTAGATAALKLVGETFPWREDSHLVMSRDNHNSVLGIRE